MKKTFLLVFISSVLLLSCSRAPESDQATTSEAKEVTENAGGNAYTVDPSASKITWIGTKVSGYHSGTINITGGDVQVKDGAVTGGKINLDMKSLAVTGPKGSDAGANAKLQGHLTSADFFDVENNPDATFEITSIKPYSGAVVEEKDDPRQEDINQYKVTNPTHTVSGNLTMKGTTKNIEFPAKIDMTESTIDAIAKFNIDRSQWNITYPGKPDDLISNEIHLGISIKAIK